MKFSIKRQTVIKLSYLVFTIMGNVMAFLQAVPGDGIATFLAMASVNRTRQQTKNKVFIIRRLLCAKKYIVEGNV